jgi:hypothetical protein
LVAVGGTAVGAVVAVGGTGVGATDDATLDAELLAGGGGGGAVGGTGVGAGVGVAQATSAINTTLSKTNNIVLRGSIFASFSILVLLLLRIFRTGMLLFKSYHKSNEIANV